MQLEILAENNQSQTLDFLADRFYSTGTFTPEFEDDTSMTVRLGEYAHTLCTIFSEEQVAGGRKKTIEQSLYLACSIAESLGSSNISPLLKTQQQAEPSRNTQPNSIERQRLIFKKSEEYFHVNPVLKSLIDRNLLYIYTSEENKVITPIQYATSALALRQIEINNSDNFGHAH